MRDLGFSFQKECFLFSLMKDNIQGMIKDGENTSKIVSAIEEAAKFAWQNDAIFLDEQLDNMILQLVEKNKLEEINIKPPLPNIEKLKVLHIITLIPEVGGHARVVQNWVKLDKKNEHYLLITGNQEKNNILEDIIKNVKEFEAISKEMEFQNKTSIIADFVNKIQPDLVILHIHPYDVLPLLVLSNCTKIPVVFFNHADNVYSLGRSIVDFVLSFRQIANITLRKSGYSTLTSLLPLPVTIQENNDKENEKIIGKSSGKYLLSMASAFKFRKNCKLDFFKTWNKILKKNNEYKLLVIGIDEADFPNLTDSPINTNINLLGEISNPRKLIENAEYFVEPFPFGTGLGTLEAVFLGTPPIFNYKDSSIYKQGARSILNVKNHQNLPNYSSEEKYIQWIKNELETQNYKKNIFPLFQEEIINNHGEKWNLNLQKVYDEIFARFNKANEEALKRNNFKKLFFHKNTPSIRGDELKIKDYFWKLHKLPSMKRKIQASFLFFETSIKERSFSGIKTLLRLILK